MRKHPRRASVDPSWPQGWGTSDRDGMVGNIANMHWQYEWSGPRLVNTRTLVHEDELDIPQRQLGSPAILGPDPPSLRNARPESIAIDEQPVSTRYTMDGRIRVVAYSPKYVNRITTTPGNTIP